MPLPSPSTSLPPCTCLASCCWLRCALGTMDYCALLIWSLGEVPAQISWPSVKRLSSHLPGLQAGVGGPRDLESRPREPQLLEFTLVARGRGPWQEASCRWDRVLLWCDQARLCTPLSFPVWKRGPALASGVACTPEGWPVGLVQARGGCCFPGCTGLPHPSPSPPARVGLCEGHLSLALMPLLPVAVAGSWSSASPVTR